MTTTPPATMTGPCTPFRLLYEADRHAVGRMFALPAGSKYPPPVGVTGDVPVLDGPDRMTHAVAAVESLAMDGNAGLRLSPGYMAVDLDTKKLADDAWGKVRSEIEAVFGGLLPHNTTSTTRCHGHYIFDVGVLPPDVSGKVRIDGVCVGDVIRPDHRYLATGPEYLTCWHRPTPLPEKVVEWIGLKPAPSVNRNGTAPPADRDRGGYIAEGWRPADQPPTLGPGERNDGMARIAGMMMTKGGEHATLNQFHTENHQRCRPPLPDTEIEQIWASVARYHNT